MNKTITLELKLDGSGAVITGITGVSGSIVDLREVAEKEGTRFGRVMETALGNVAADVITDLRNRIQQIPGFILETGKALESQLSDLNAITGIAGKDLEELGQTAVDESVRTGIAAADQVEAYKLLASNIEIAKIGGVAGLKTLGKEVITLSQAAKIDLVTAAEAVAGSINQFGLAADQSARVVNVLAAGSKYGAAEVGDLAAAIKESGTTAADANLEFEVTVGALEVMSQRMLKGSQAGTNFRNVITILRTSSAEFAKNGINNINLESDGLVVTLEKLKPLLSDAGAMAKIFGRENLNAASMLITNAGEVANMTKKVTDTTTAQEQAAIQTDNLAGSTDKLLQLVKGAAIGAYEGFSDELKELIDTTIAAALWMGEHKGEMAKAVKIVAVLTVAIATYSASVQVATNWTKLAAKWETIATFAKKAYAVATGQATLAQVGFNTAIKANPIGLFLTLLASAATAFFLFRNRASEATKEIEDQGEAIRDLTEGIKELESAQLFDRYKNLKEEQAALNKHLEETNRLQAELEAGPKKLKTHTERKELIAQELALKKQIHDVDVAIAGSILRGAQSLTDRKVVLEKEVAALESQGEITDDLVSKRNELQYIESQILEVKKQSNVETENEDSAAGSVLEKRELELLLMKEGQEKKLAMIDLQIDQEIEKYREAYADKFPGLFADLEKQLLENKQRIIAAITSAGSQNNPVPIVLEAEVELPEGEIELGQALQDGLVSLDGALTSVNHNLSVLHNRYLEAQSAQERWDIFQKIKEMEAMQMEAERLTETMNIFSDGGIEAFTALGEGIGAAMVGIKGATADMAIALQMILADIAKSIGQLLLKQAVALAVAGQYAKAGRLAAAGTGLIILGSVIGATIQKRQEEADAARRAEGGSAYADVNSPAMVEARRIRFEEEDRARGFAAGGLVRGPGSGISDSINARLSNGEFVVNAAATRKAYPILSAINDGGALNISAKVDFDQAKLEAAVSRAVLGGLAQVKFEADGRALKGTLSAQESLNRMVGV